MVFQLLDALMFEETFFQTSDLIKQSTAEMNKPSKK